MWEPIRNEARNEPSTLREPPRNGDRNEPSTLREPTRNGDRNEPPTPREPTRNGDRNEPSTLREPTRNGDGMHRRPSTPRVLLNNLRRVCNCQLDNDRSRHSRKRIRRRKCIMVKTEEIRRLTMICLRNDDVLPENEVLYLLKRVEAGLLEHIRKTS